MYIHAYVDREIKWEIGLDLRAKFLGGERKWVRIWRQFFRVLGSTTVPSYSLHAKVIRNTKHLSLLAPLFEDAVYRESNHQQSKFCLVTFVFFVFFFLFLLTINDWIFCISMMICPLSSSNLNLIKAFITLKLRTLMWAKLLLLIFFL